MTQMLDGVFAGVRDALLAFGGAQMLLEAKRGQVVDDETGKLVGGTTKRYPVRAVRSEYSPTLVAGGLVDVAEQRMFIEPPAGVTPRKGDVLYLGPTKKDEPSTVTRVEPLEAVDDVIMWDVGVMRSSPKGAD